MHLEYILRLVMYRGRQSSIAYAIVRIHYLVQTWAPVPRTTVRVRHSVQWCVSLASCNRARPLPRATVHVACLMQQCASIAFCDRAKVLVGSKATANPNAFPASQC